jgi:hypothetical protein
MSLETDVVVGSSSGVHRPPADLDALSLDPEMQLALPAQPVAERGFLGRFVKRLDVILLIVLVFGGIGLVLFALARDAEPPVTSSEVSRYGTITLPLDELVAGKDLDLPSVTTVTINGPMQLNSGLRFAPSPQPNGALPGQLYFDDTAKQLAYFNGDAFVYLSAQVPASTTTNVTQLTGVQGIGGLTGQVDVGSGLTTVNGRLSASGVLSLLGQTGDVTLTAGNGIAINGTTFSNTGLLSLASGSASLTVTTDASGNAVITSTGAGSGTVDSAGGTVNRLPKFTAAQTIADSLLSDDGATVTVAGNLTVNSTLTLGNALSVGNGGTGAVTLAANGVLVGQGSGAITSVTAGGNGLCLLSTAGAPAFSACPGGGGSSVDSLNGLTGSLNIANASGVGTTVTINDATTGAKGIASFNGTNFSVLGGVVNTVQNIGSGASPTFTAVNTNTITPVSALTLGSITNTALLQGSITTITSTGGGNDVIVDSADTIELLDNTNVTGNLDVSGTFTSGTANAFQVAAGGTITTAGSGVFQGGAATVGTSTQAGVLVLFDGSSNTGSLQLAALGQNTVYTLPDPGGATASICLTTGNCAGSGGGVTSAGGTVNRLAKFTGAQAIGDSIITDNGTTVTIAGALSVNTLTPTGVLTVGAITQNAVLQGAVTTITATNGGVTNTLGFATPSGGNKTITVPNANGTIAVSATGPLALDAAGNLTCLSCVTSGGGGGGVGAVDSLNGLTGVLAIANASGSGATITINDATTGAKGIASFNVTNFSVTAGAVNTVQDITTTSDPMFRDLTVSTLSVSSSQAAAAMLVVNNTNGSGSGNLIDLQLNSSSRFNVSPAGAIAVTGNITSNTALALASGGGGALTLTPASGTVIVNGANLQRAGTTFTVDVNNASNSTLTITNAAAGVASLTVEGNATLQGGTMTVGTASQAGLLVISDGSSHTGSIQTAALGQDTVYTLPDPNGATATICLNTGNCAGSGTGVTTSGAGTNGVIAKFTTSQNIEPSLLSEVGSVITANGSFNLTVGNQFRINNVQVTSAILSNDSDLAKLSASNQTFTGNMTVSGNLTANGNTTLGNAGSDTLTVGATLQGGTPLVFEGGTVDASQLSLLIASLTGDQQITLPDETGTVCLRNSVNCGFATGSGSGNYIQNTTTVQTNANIAIQSAADTSVSLLIKQRVAQSVNSLLVTDSNNNPQFAINNFGDLIQTNKASFAGAVAIGGLASGGEQLRVEAATAATQGIVIYGNGGQTADLLTIDGDGTRALSYTGGGTLALAGGSAQADDLITVTIPSNATGSFIKFINGVTDVLNVTNGGATTLRTTTDSTNAFRILNSGSGELVNADSVDSMLTLLGNNTGRSASFTTNGALMSANRAGHAVVRVNNYVYVLGGCTGGTAQTGTMYAPISSDGSIGTFTAGTSLPNVSCLNAATSYNGYLYVLGGSNSATGDEVYRAKVLSDGSLSAWTTETNLLPIAIRRHSMVAANGYLYVTGGENFVGAVNNLDLYKARINPNGTLGTFATTSSWLPSARKDAGTTVSNGYWYLLTTSPSVATNQGLIYAKLNADGTIGSAQTDDAPAAVSSSSIAVANGYLYNMGGNVGGSAVTSVYNVAINSDGSVGTWAANTNNLPAARSAGAGFSFNGFLYYLGGENGTEQDDAYYAKVSKVTLGGSLDLVGISGDSLEAGSGGSLTAGNTYVAGTLDVMGETRLKRGLTVDQDFSLNGQAAIKFGGASDAFLVYDSSAAPIMSVGDTSVDILNNDLYVGATSSSALEIANASGDSLLVADTSTGEVSIGSGYDGAVLTLSSRSATSDPSGSNGAMYYSVSRQGFRCYENSEWNYCNEPRSLLRSYSIQEDFMNGSDNTTSLTMGDLGWEDIGSGVNAFNGKVPADNYHRPGVIQQTVNTSGDFASVWLGGVAGTDEQVLLGGDKVTVDMAINIATLATTTHDYTYRFGLCDQTNADCTDGVYFEYNRATSTNWITATASNGSRTKNTTSNAVSTGWHNYSMVIRTNGTSPTSVDFYVDGVLIGSNNTAGTIPNGAGRTTTPMFQFRKTNGAADRQVSVDFFSMNSAFTQR